LYAVLKRLVVARDRLTNDERGIDRDRLRSGYNCDATAIRSTAAWLPCDSHSTHGSCTAVSQLSHDSCREVAQRSNRNHIVAVCRSSNHCHTQ